MNLKKRIQILLAFLVGAPFLLLLLETYRTGRGTLLRQMRNDAIHTARLQAAQLETSFEAPRGAAEGIARAIAADPAMTPEALRALLRTALAEVPSAFGFAVALADGGGPGKPLVPYVFRDRGQLRETDLDTAAYGFRTQEWYARPLAEDRPVWTRAYLDRGGGGHVYLVSCDGAVLAHPKLPMLDDPGAATGIPRLGALAPLLAKAGEDAMSLEDPFTRQRAWLVEVPLPPLAEHRGGLGWSLIVSWPETVRLQPLADLGKQFLVLYLALGGAALLFLNRSMNDLISRPIARLARQARRFAQGDFGDLGQPPEEAEELQHLGSAIQLLGKALKEQAAAPEERA